jgi:hypothetical protein
MNRVVFLQPLGGAQAEPPTPADDSDAQVPTPQGPDSASSGQGPSTVVNVGVNINAATTQEVCQDANLQSFVSAAGYGFAAVFLGLLVYGVLYRKLWAGGEINRKVIAVLVAGAAGFGLAFADPSRTDTFKLCLNDQAMLAYMFLPKQEFARALALGFAPALVLTLLGTLVVQKILAR